MDILPSELATLIVKHREDTSPITILEEIQSTYRYLPQEALVLVSEWLGMPLSQLYSVATFYHAFSLVPRGRHTIQVCTGTACHVRGSIQILNRLCTQLDVKPGETTADREFSLETVNCVGCCALGPVAVLDGEYEGHMSPKKVDSMLKQARRQNGDGR